MYKAHFLACGVGPILHIKYHFTISSLLKLTPQTSICILRRIYPENTLEEMRFIMHQSLQNTDRNENDKKTYLHSAELNAVAVTENVNILLS